jgi:hypothetical protein
METNVFKELAGYNTVKIGWHKHARYNKEYNDFLDKLLTFKGGRDPACINHIKKYFKDAVKPMKGSKDDNVIKLSYTHKVGKKLDNYITVHKSQGKSITENHSIYDITRMPLKVLYTALSRTVDPNMITIFI